MRIDMSRRSALVATSVFASISPLYHPLPALATSAASALGNAAPSAAAAALFAACQGRSPTSWRAEETPKLEGLIEELRELQVPMRSQQLRGKWRLAYQSNLERTSPLAELLPPNEQYQIIGRSDLIHVTEVVPRGLLERRAAGSLRAEESGAGHPSYRAEMTQGALCGSLTIGRREKANIGRLCAPLPVTKGQEQRFYVQFVDERIRVGQTAVESRRRGGSSPELSFARTVHVRVRSFGGFS